MKILNLLPILCVSILSVGCVGFVGGECKYEKSLGIAKITKTKNRCIADFYPLQEPLREWNLKKNILGLEIECQDFEQNKTYPAVYNKIIKGSCIPFRLDVYKKTFLIASINRSSVCLNEDTLTPDFYNQKKLEDISSKYTLLSRFYKNTKLKYAIIQPSKYSEEYAFSLNIVESKKFQQLMLTKFNLFNLLRFDTKNRHSQCQDNEIEIIFNYNP